MPNDTFEQSFQYFSVVVPTEFPVDGAPDSIPGTSSESSYLRLGDTPTDEDTKGQGEPGQEQRTHATGTPAWPSDLYKAFAPLNAELRVNAGDAIDFDASFEKNVGWLDHSNGHRVTTTHGDKVEVITGNYKLIVMGRDADPAGSTGFDMSGGHTVNWAKTPGCVRTITAESGTFKVTHVTDSGHEYTVFEGFDTDHTVGGSTSISVMGGTNDRTTKGSGAMELVVDQAWSKLIVDVDYGTTVASVTAGQPSNWPTLTESSDLKQNASTFSAHPTTMDQVMALTKATNVYEACATQNFYDFMAVSTHYEEDTRITGDCRDNLEAASVNSTVTVTGTVTETWSCANYNEYFSGQRKNVTNCWPGDETEHHFSAHKFDLIAAATWWELAVGAMRTAVHVFAVDTDLILSPLLRTDLCYSAFRIEQTSSICAKQTPVEVVQKGVSLVQRALASRSQGMSLDANGLTMIV